MQWCVQLYHVTVGNKGIKTEAEAELRQVRALKKNVAHHVLSTVTLWRKPVLGRHPPRGKVKQWRGPLWPAGQALFKRLRGMGFAVGGLCGTWSASQGFRQRVKHVNHVSGGDKLLYVK